MRKDKVSFDYDGKVIDIKPDNKQHLISKTVKTKIY